MNAKLTLILSALQKEYDKTKTQRDQEEKLIVSAWYNMVCVYTHQLEESVIMPVLIFNCSLARTSAGTDEPVPDYFYAI